jgi:hypothetical protein
LGLGGGGGAPLPFLSLLLSSSAADSHSGEDSGDADEPDAGTSAGAVLTELMEMFKEKNGRDPTDAEVAQWMEQIRALNEPQSGDDEDDTEQDPYSSDGEGTESERAAAISERRCEKHGRDHCDRCQMEACEELNDPEDLPLVRAAASGSMAVTRRPVEAGVRAGDKRGKVVNVSRMWRESEQKWG